MSFERLLLCGLACAATLSAHAQSVDVSASTGLPQVSVVDRQAMAWRYMALRAETSNFGLEARLPNCIDAARRGLSSGAALQGCSTQSVDGAQAHISRQLKAWASLPSLVRGGPEVEFTLRTWGAAGRSESGSRVGSGTQGEVELSQQMGSATAYAGYSAPVGLRRAADGWRSAYAGLSWRPTRRHELGFDVEHSRDTASGERARDLTLRYALKGSPNARLRAHLTRGSDAADRWQSGLSIDWRF